MHVKGQRQGSHLVEFALKPSVADDSVYLITHLKDNSKDNSNKNIARKGTSMLNLQFKQNVRE